MRKILLLIALACMLFFACSKSDAPDPVHESPVFSLFMETDSINNGVSLVAGTAGTYLFSRVDRGTDNVLVMSGAFAGTDCPAGDCPGSVRIEFRNDNQENFAEPLALFQGGSSWNFKSPFSDSFALKTVAIQWVNNNGFVFRSDLIPQPSDSTQFYFNIHASEPWELNERGETTWKMDIDFSCWVFSKAQQSERKILGGGTIAVGYR